MVTKEQSAVVIAPEDPTLYTCHAAQEGTTPIVLEKPSEDGYNWRKYGQKNVKGKEYVRSYYRCSYPHCQAKKQVERSQDGKISDITYLGKHDHLKPHSESREAIPLLLSPQVHTPDCPKPAVSEEKSSNVHPVTDDTKPKEKCELPPTVTLCYPTTPVSCQLSAESKDDQNESLISKRRKKSVDGADFTVEKSGHESRHVIRSVSEVDVVNDGYRWRKYGQKMVKGNPNPRSYYRCTTAGCPVKKHVERASHDPKVVITTYEGEHDHSVPPIRTVLPQITAPSAGPTDLNGDSKTKSEDTDVALNGTACKEAEKNRQESSLALEVVTKPELSGEHDSQESEQTMEDPICKGSNSDNIDHSSKLEEIGSNDQDTEGKDLKTNHVDQTSEEQSDQEMEDPICKDAISDKTDQSSKPKENVVPNDAKLEDLSTEQQKTDLVLDESYHEAESNGEARLISEAAKR